MEEDPSRRRVASLKGSLTNHETSFAYYTIIATKIASAQGMEEHAARRWADSQLAEARTMLDLPALAPPDALLMGATAMQNTFTCQPQVPVCRSYSLLHVLHVIYCAILVSAMGLVLRTVRLRVTGTAWSLLPLNAAVLQCSAATSPLTV